MSLPCRSSHAVACAVTIAGRYPIAVPSGSTHQAEANLLINVVLSVAGRNVLLSRGFIGT
jgi:ABC-type molybdate transport system substrate-binding protein